jgi:heterodisulfide reductase subunit A
LLRLVLTTIWKKPNQNNQEKLTMPKDIIGATMVVGGGIAGMQSALDLAESGYYVYLVEKSSAIGGLMSQLDKTFPTNDCAM